MALTKSTADIGYISALADEPALTAALLKAEFDKAPEALQTFINSLIDELDLALAALDTALAALDTALAAKQATITSGTTAPSGGSDGDLYIWY